MWDWLKKLIPEPKACPTCEVLREQLHEARLREQRMNRQIEGKDSTIDRVIASKFDRAQVTPAPLPKQSPMFTESDLADVLTMSDEQFSELQ